MRIVFLFVSVLLFSCSKEETQNPVPLTAAKVMEGMYFHSATVDGQPATRFSIPLQDSARVQLFSSGTLIDERGGKKTLLNLYDTTIVNFPEHGRQYAFAFEFSDGRKDTALYLMP